METPLRSEESRPRIVPDSEERPRRARVADTLSKSKPTKSKSTPKNSKPKSKPKPGEWDGEGGSSGRGTRMDITREATGSKRKPILIGAGIAVVAVIALLLAFMKPAAPSVQRTARSRSIAAQSGPSDPARPRRSSQSIMGPPGPGTNACRRSATPFQSRG